MRLSSTLMLALLSALALVALCCFPAPAAAAAASGQPRRALLGTKPRYSPCLRDRDCASKLKCIDQQCDIPGELAYHSRKSGERCTPAAKSECEPPLKCMVKSSGTEGECAVDTSAGCVHCKKAGESCTARPLSECEEKPVKLVCQYGRCQAE